ncbi:MAG: fibronectin type III-like domain-contianing protein, partial [Bacteroidota bacterium]
RPSGREHGENMVLRKFQRVHLPANGSTKVSMKLSAEDLAELTGEGNTVLSKGEYQLMIGTSSPFQRSVDLGAPQWVTGTVTVR